MAQVHKISTAAHSTYFEEWSRIAEERRNSKEKGQTT